MADVPAWPGPVVCRYSSWDHRVHAFPDLGELNSVAVCTHIARTDSLTEPPEGARWCEACRMIRAAQLEVRREMADEWLHTPGRRGREHLVGFWEKDEVEAIKEDNPELAGLTDQQVVVVLERARVEQERKLMRDPAED